MSSLDNPVIRLFFIFGGGFLLASIYIQITGWLPAPYQWYPYGSFPSIGSLPYITTFLVATLISGVLWWYAAHVIAKRSKSQLLAQLGIRQR